MYIIFASAMQKRQIPLCPGSGAQLRAREALIFLLFKYAFSWFPEHLIIFQDISVLSYKDFFFATPIEINFIHLNVTPVLQNKGEFYDQFGYKLVIT